MEQEKVTAYSNEDSSLKGDTSIPLCVGVEVLLTKLQFNTKFDICDDDVIDNNHYNRFNILEDKGEYFHWLNERTNPSDIEFKNSVLPITIPSNSFLEFKAFFKIAIKDNFSAPPKIRVTCKNELFLFETTDGFLEDEFEITFTSSNNPYENTIHFFDDFELIFEYSKNDTDWFPSGTSINRLYLTRGEILFEEFHEHMKVFCRDNRDKPNISESLLWLGCKYADSLKTNDDEIVVDKIFQNFENLKVTRVREKEFMDEGLGYWRGHSSLRNGFALGLPGIVGHYRDLRKDDRTLLKHGEGRCGEFSDLFGHILLVQGIETFLAHITTTQFINKNKSYNYRLNEGVPQVYFDTVFLLKDWEISEPNPPTEINTGNYKAQGNKNPMHFFWDHVFIVMYKNNQFKYYDPSYGVKGNLHSQIESVRNEWINNSLKGILLAKKDSNGAPFYDKSHSQLHLDLFTAEPTKTNYKYKLITNEIENYLATRIFSLKEAL